MLRTVGLVTLIAVLLFTSVLSVHADPKVTLCERDNQRGNGTNLSDALAMGGYIRFDCGQPDIYEIVVTRTHDIGVNTVIDGGGSTIVLDGDNQTLLFRLVNPGATLTLRNLNIRNGGFVGRNGYLDPNRASEAGVVENAVGGGINIEDCVLSENLRAIVNTSGSLTVRGSSFSANYESAISNYRGRVLIYDSVFNDSTGGMASSALYSSEGIVEVDGGQFRNNSVDGFGGAILAQDAQVTIRNSVFMGNSAGADGGAIRIEDSTLSLEDVWFEANQAQRGGAISIGGQQVQDVEIRRGEFRHNEAGISGGAIHRDGDSVGDAHLQIQYSTFVNNNAEDGGALYLGEELDNRGSVDLAGVLFLENVATSRGGGLFGVRVPLTANGVAFVDNEANGSGGAIYLEDPGQNSRVVNALVVRNAAPDAGGILAAGGLQIINSTLVDNQGLALSVLPTRASNNIQLWANVRLLNTIVSFNEGGNCLDRVGILMDDGHNIQFPGAGCGSTVPVIPPILDARYAPYGFGPARRGGDNATCMGPVVGGQDLYGQPRAVFGNCSIGAIEEVLHEEAPTD